MGLLKEWKHFICLFVLIVGDGLLTTTSQDVQTYYVDTLMSGCLGNMQTLPTYFSEMQCAIGCGKMNCMGFKSQDGICLAFQAPDASFSSNSRLFKKIMYENVDSNVALNKNVTSDGQYDRSFVIFVVDGDESSDIHFHSQTHTLFPWLLVDLGKEYMIREVQVVPHGSGPHTYFFTEMSVRVGLDSISNGDFSSYTLFATYAGPPSSEETVTFTPSSVCVYGRYLSLQKLATSGYSYFAVNELKVFTMKEVSF